MRDLELRGAGNLLGDEQSGHVAALGFELYMQMLDEAVRAMDPDEDGDGAAPSRCASTSTSTPTCRADYIPYEQAKVDVHRRIAGAREVAELMELRDELDDRFGELPEPLENLITLQQARIKLGEAGATRGHLPRRPARRHADRARLRARAASCARSCPARSTSPGARSCRVRVPDDPAQRFPAVVQRGRRAAGRAARGRLKTR